MLLFRLIAPGWLIEEKPGIRKVLEGLFTSNEIQRYNQEGYNIYYLPNHPSEYEKGTTVDGTMVDVFNYVFVDCDLKDGVYPDKEAFIEKLGDSGLPLTRVVDSGNGVHAYWQVSNLDAISYLRFQRRLMRVFKTDEAVGQLFQLMRYPNTLNTKIKDNQKLCEVLYESDVVLTSEELNRLLPPITAEDELYCQQHYAKTFNINQVEIEDSIPPKFGKLLRDSHEAKSLWAGNSDDRSKSDYRLGHLMFANGFTKEEALSVLANSAKALQRAPIHRANYARNIVDKIWTFEEAEVKTDVNLSPTVRDILSRGEKAVEGTRFPCNKLIDDTESGFRLGQVIGIVAGSGVGKTTLTLNTFLWFAENNPDYHHFFFSLEQPVEEIARRVRTICQENDALYDKIHIVSNYDQSGTYVNFSLEMIEDHLVNWQGQTGQKVGACVIDHIGVLSRSTKNGESDGLIQICRRMKATAIRLNMMLIMLSQAPREKAGIGDLELNKDAAYGTVNFESFVDYLICLWQPLKRVYAMGAPTLMAIKFAKIRHKRQNVDRIQEDVCYQLYFDPTNERIRELTQDEETSAKYFVAQATSARKADRKTDIVPYKSRRIVETEIEDGTKKH